MNMMSKTLVVFSLNLLMTSPRTKVATAPKKTTQMPTKTAENEGSKLN